MRDDKRLRLARPCLLVRHRAIARNLDRRAAIDVIADVFEISEHPAAFEVTAFRSIGIINGTVNRGIRLVGIIDHAFKGIGAKRFIAHVLDFGAMEFIEHVVPIPNAIIFVEAFFVRGTLIEIGIGLNPFLAEVIDALIFRGVVDIIEDAKEQEEQIQHRISRRR